ncbi:hypothetical protein [Pseudomonas prosekii]|uniref:Uncharacterized protein n=1 Tax=Pseudomonas prosekii TaxID=1148509 RepID=A0A1H2B4F6_9PSED|nr:hypothetical protein [Pseudomonas prosekii]SDT52819.1 hypothetical protein SAMN05216222_4899 [Pseudomonas prosekii]
MALQMIKKDQAAAGARWVEFDKDTKILLVGIDNAEYQVGLERMRRRIVRNDARFDEGQVGIVPGELTEHQNHAMLLGHFIVKGWTGVLDAEGNELKYTPSAAAELLDHSLDFFLFVLREGSAVATDNASELEETVKKPSPASSGKKSGAASKQKSEA